MNISFDDVLFNDDFPSFPPKTASRSGVLCLYSRIAEQVVPAKGRLWSQIQRVFNGCFLKEVLKIPGVKGVTL